MSVIKFYDMINKINPFLIIVLLFFLFFSGIIRHDINEKEYLALASQKQFDCVGTLLIEGDPDASCVLIKPNYVLTAAHCLYVSGNYTTDTLEIDGKIMIDYLYPDERKAEPNDVSVSFKEKIYTTKRIVIHQNYSDTLFEYDIAIIELNEFVKDVTPAMINFDFNEHNCLAVGVGYGVSGVSTEPENVAPFNKKIAGQNSIDSIGGYIHSGKHALLMCDFDHPSDKNCCNRMGSDIPSEFEYLCSGGDSGGGLFIEENSKWKLVGICTGAGFDLEQFFKTRSYYGQIMEWTRISVFADWIEENSRQVE